MCPFEKPYKEITRFTMYKDLYKLPADDPLPFGYRVEPWFPSLLPAFAAALAVSVSDSPDIEIYPKLASKDGCVELLKEIAAAPDFLSGVSWLGFFKREPCAVLMASWNPVQREGIINIIGVAPRHRRLAIGSRLLIRALWALRDRKITSAVLRVNRECRGAVQFFRAMGFQVSDLRKYS